MAVQLSEGYKSELEKKQMSRKKDFHFGGSSEENLTLCCSAKTFNDCFTIRMYS